MRQPSRLVLAAAVVVLTPTFARADCPSLRWDDYKFIARLLLARFPIVFTGTITGARLVGDGKDHGGGDYPFEEDYEVAKVIQGASPRHALFKVTSPCDSEADCFKTTDEANDYLKVVWERRS